MHYDENGEMEIDLLELIRVLLKKLWLIMLCGFLAACATFLVTKFLITPQYSSTSKLYILSKSTSITSLADIQLGTQLTQDYMVLVTSRPVVEEVISNLGLELEYEDMLKKMEVTNNANTRILNITIQDPNPILAKEIADEFADVSTIRIAEIMEIDAPNVVEWGHVATKKTSPSTLKNTIIGAVIGAFIVCAIIVINFMLDDTIKTSEDVEKNLGINVLGIIPIDETVAGTVRRDKKKRRRAN